MELTPKMQLTKAIVPLVLLCISSLAFGDITKLDIQTPLKAVYLLPDNDTELVTVAMVVLAGEVDFKGPEGLSHYLEHLMFWHADNVKGEAIHARDGNAWVNGLITTFYNRGENSELPDMIEFSRRILLPPELKPSFMLGERDVVIREYDLRISENPNSRVLTDIRRELYDNHPVSRSVIGTPKSIGSLTIKHAIDFHKQYYLPANSILIVSGNVTEKQIRELVNSRFSEFSAPPAFAPHTQAWRTANVSGSLNQINEYVEKQAKSSRLIYSSLSNWSNDTGDTLQERYTLQFVQRLFESVLPGRVC